MEDSEEEIPAKKGVHTRGLLLTIVQLSVCLLMIVSALLVRLMGGEVYAWTATWFFDNYNSSVFTDAKLPLLPYRDEVSFQEESTINGSISGKSSDDVMKNIHLRSPLKKLTALSAGGNDSKGTDFEAKNGEEIFACLDGEVRIAGRDDSLGNYIVLSHENDICTLYGGCSKTLVKKGDKVKAGDKIALAGQSGNAQRPRLHFELIINGKNTAPSPYLGIKSSDEA